MAKSDGSFREIPSLLLKILLLFVEKSPFLLEALLLLQHVAVVQEGSSLVVARAAELLLHSVGGSREPGGSCM